VALRVHIDRSRCAAVPPTSVRASAVPQPRPQGMRSRAQKRQFAGSARAAIAWARTAALRYHAAAVSLTGESL